MTNRCKETLLKGCVKSENSIAGHLGKHFLLNVIFVSVPSFVCMVLFCALWSAATLVMPCFWKLKWIQITAKWWKNRQSETQPKQNTSWSETVNKIGSCNFGFYVNLDFSFLKCKKKCKSCSLLIIVIKSLTFVNGRTSAWTSLPPALYPRQEFWSQYPGGPVCPGAPWLPGLPGVPGLPGRPGEPWLPVRPSPGRPAKPKIVSKHMTNSEMIKGEKE